MYNKNINFSKFKIYGFIPARMAATRFPGKPLKKILGKPMIQHVYENAKKFKYWNNLFLTTCDKEIKNFAKKNSIPNIMTSKKHKRCLDRVYEAARKTRGIKNNDIIICVQGDEPMLSPIMINNAINPILKRKVNCTVLAMDIIHKDQFFNKNIVKIIHDENDEVLYTSRAPIPYTNKFSKKIGAKRIYGIFGFKFSYLRKFTKMKSSNLEILESCDTNRLCFHGEEQYVIDYDFYPSYSVDRPSHINIVTKYLKKDKLLKKYKSLNEL